MHVLPAALKPLKLFEKSSHTNSKETRIPSQIIPWKHTMEELEKQSLWDAQNEVCLVRFSTAREYGTVHSQLTVHDSLVAQSHTSKIWDRYINK